MTPAPPPPHPKLTWKAFLRDVGRTLVTLAAILAVVAVPFALLNLVHVYATTEGQALVTRDLHNMRYSLNDFHARHQRYPSTAEGFQALVDGSHMEKLPLDPWERPYGYELREGVPVMWSLGADGVAGGEGVDEDIVRPGGDVQDAGVCLPPSHP